MASSKDSATRNLFISVLWIGIIICLAVAWKFFVVPENQKKLADETGSEGRYRHRITFSLDSFSGYAVLRSKKFAQLLAKEECKVVIQDDKADYNQRIRALKSGASQFAVFTVDSWITAGERLGEYPGTILLMIDESRGADALICQAGSFNSIQDLNQSDVKLQLTPNSPSEFFARVMLSHFNLDKLSTNWQTANGAADVYQKVINDNGGKTAYVLWEPWISKAVRSGGAKILLDSSKLKGYILDVLVVNRRFLKENPLLVNKIVKAYFTAGWQYASQNDGLVNLVVEDGARGGEKIESTEANQVTQGILWKNTLENYAHFGILASSDRGGLGHIEDLIQNIMDVLIETGAVTADPLKGDYSSLYYDTILKELHGENFHPSLLSGGKAETIRSGVRLKPLSEAEWQKIVPVGEMKIPSLSFGRGGARIHLGSQRQLKKIAKNLSSWPQYYLIVRGHARNVGDPEANLLLAKSRATAVLEFLETEGISKNRLRIETTSLDQRGGKQQSVSFVLGQLPY
jgi:outer membrane protein OmpA-like peptidoglycan-associated protein/ABC-type nitrate/sulfonate/bicarbonate transport system substrate-binding protein